MEPKFKSGDLVRAIDDHDDFEKGDVFTVEDGDHPDRSDYYITVLEDTEVYHRALFEPYNALEELESALQHLEQSHTALVEALRILRRD